MPQIFKKLQNWQKRKPSDPTTAPVPFQVECECGKTNGGQRQKTHQVISCAQCKRPLFVLPLSPLPPVDSTSISGVRGVASGRRVWLTPSIAGAVTLVLIVGAVIFFSPFAKKPPIPSNGNPKTAAAQAKAQADEALQLFRQGQFRLAANRFDTVLLNLAAADRRQDAAAAKQASLFADLLNDPLETVVQHAVNVHNDEWAAEFPVRFAGKSIIFDLSLQRTETGRYQYHFEFPPAAGEVRIAFETVPLLKRLPLDLPRRVIFGARLASVRLEQPGPVWVIRFQPDSGVLITEHDAVIRYCPSLHDEETKQLLKQQKEIGF